MPTNTQRPLDRLMALTMQVHRILRSQNATSMQGVGVNILQLHGLLVVREQPGITMKELAQRLAVSSSSATVFVARLEEQGLLKRLHDRENRKIVRVELTVKGRAIAEKASAEGERNFRKLFGALPQSEQQQLAAIFDHVIHIYRSSHDG